ncbi:uncharacterized protein TNCV_4778691 [Trichonephila clavipes]|nr:uncharacterized protein TNCV_4778691 [Trichonephila clavipes]
MGHERKIKRQKKRKFHVEFPHCSKKKVSEGSISSEKLGRGLSDTLFNVDSETLSGFLKGLKQNRSLRYTSYYGDGDSKAFNNVKDIYGYDSVVKYECIGHVQKRVGSRLRKLKKSTKA